MRKLASLIFLMLSGSFVTVCKSQDSLTFNQGGTQSNGYYEEIPYEFVQNKAIVDVTIAGEIYRFIWDTGAPLLISDRLASKLNPDTLKITTVADVNNHQDSMYMVRVDGIELGGVRFDGVPALVADNESVFLKCFGVDGFIGSNIMRNTIVHFDSERKVIVLTVNVERLSLTKNHRTPLKLNPYQSMPIATIQPGKRARQELIFDSGDDGLYSLNEHHYKFFSERRPKTVQLKEKGFGSTQLGIHGKGTDSIRHRVLLPAMKINGITFTNVITSTHDDNNSRLGADLLNYGNVTVDYINRHFYFTPHDSNTKKIDYQKRRKNFSIQPIIHEDKLVIGAIWGEEDLGVKVGDRILKFDNIELVGVDICQVLIGDMFSTLNDYADLTIELGNGEIKEIRVSVN